MAQSKGNIAARVTEILRPTVEGLGFSIWDVEYVKEGAAWHLRITIDHPDGVDINGCETVHRAVDPVLDEYDPIEDAYYLEVSSPGLEREIRTPEHYTACLGETVEVKFFTAIDGRKGLVGELKAYSPETEQVTVVLAGGEEIAVARKQISKCNIYFDFENDTVTEETEK